MDDDNAQARSYKGPGSAADRERREHNRRLIEQHRLRDGPPHYTDVDDGRYSSPRDRPPPVKYGASHREPFHNYVRDGGYYDGAYDEYDDYVAGRDYENERQYENRAREKDSRRAYEDKVRA